MARVPSTVKKTKGEIGSFLHPEGKSLDCQVPRGDVALQGERSTPVAAQWSRHSTVQGGHEKISYLGEKIIAKDIHESMT